MPPESNLSVRWTAVLLAAILILAAAVRLPGLGSRGYSLDECWTAEIASGRGSLHLNLPKNLIMSAPELFELKDAPPWWHVWTHLEMTHPPLYYILLRLWMDAFGEGDGVGRLFSVIASVASVALLFDVARILNGRSVALWASLLMALSEPQVEHARLTRNYAMLVLFALAAADVLLRIEKIGMTRRRFTALVLALLATMLTHYFCIGTVAALGIYACARLQGSQRKTAILAFTAAGILFIVCWGPFMWRQRSTFSTSDPQTAFLHEDEDHMRNTVRRFLSLPIDMVLPRERCSLTEATTAGILYILPLILWRRRPDLQLWGLWLIGANSVVLILDLTRQTAHLEYLRYTLLAGPAAFVLFPAVVNNLKQKWIGFALPAVAAIAAAIALPAAYQNTNDDPHNIAANIRPLIGPDDLLASVGIGDSAWSAGAKYMILSRYLSPVPCPALIMDIPPGPQNLALAMHHREIFLLSDSEDAEDYFPPAKHEGGRKYFGFGLVWFLKP